MVYELRDRKRVDEDVKALEFEDKVNPLESEKETNPFAWWQLQGMAAEWE